MAREIVVKFVGDTAALDAAFNRVGAGAGRLDQQLSRSGAKLTRRLTLPIIAAAGASVKLSGDFEDTMNKIVGLVGRPREEVDGFKESILKLGPAIGKSPKELGEAMFFITSAGFKGKAAMDVLTASAKASAAGLGETKTVADAVTSAVNAYKKSGLTAAQATDVMTAAIREGKLETTELAGTLGKVIPIGSQMGVSFGDIGAALASMSKSGIAAAEGTTALSGLMMSFLKPTDKADKMLIALGLSAQGVRTSIKEKGLLTTMTDLKKTFETSAEPLARYVAGIGETKKSGTVLGISMKELHATIKKEGVEAAVKDLTARFSDTNATMTDVIGNKRALTGFLALTGDQAKENAGIFERLNGTVGDTDKAFDEAAQGSGFRMRQAMASMQVTAIRLGDTIAPVAQKLLAAFAGLAGFLSKNTEVFFALLAAAALLGPGLQLVALVMKVKAAHTALATGATLAQTTAQWGLNAALLAFPGTWIVLGLVAVGVALVVLWKKSETFRDIVHGVWDAVKSAASSFASFFTTTIPNAFTTVVNWVKSHWPEIVTLISGPFAPIVLLATDAFGVRSKLVEAFTWLISRGSVWGGAIKDAVVGGLVGIGNAAWDVVLRIGTWIVRGMDTILGWGNSVGTWVKNAAVKGITGIGNAVWDVVTNIWAKYLEMGETIRGWGAKVGTWIKNAVTGSLLGIGNAVWDVVKNIWSKLSEKTDTIKSWGSSIARWISDAVLGGIASLPGAVWDKLKGIGSAITSNIPGRGDARDPDLSHAGSFNLMGASPVMAPFAASAAAHGLVVTSGLRPGAITASGRPSDHGIGKALDVSNGVNTPQMAAFFRSLIGNRFVKQAFYDPLGSIFGGAWSSYRQGGHSDHVHVATYDQGGILPPGVTLAINKTGVNELVIPPGGGGGGIHLHVHAGTVIGGDLERVARDLERPIRSMIARVRIDNVTSGIG